MTKMDTNSSELHVTEGVGGVWFYHLSVAETNARSLCGAQTMNTQIPLSSWGVRGHLKEGWCAKCATMGADALHRAGVEATSERDLLTSRLSKLKYRMEDECKTGSGIWSQAVKFLDRLGTPGELPEDLGDAHALLARHNA